VEEAGLVRVTGDWALRHMRLYLPDGNRLRRTSDLIEGLAVMLFLTLCIASLAPAILIGNHVYQAGVAQGTSGQWVTAKALENAPAATWVSTEGVETQLRTRVAWTGAGGKKAVGEAPLPQNTKAGAVVRVWLDRAGKPGDGPPALLGTIASGVITGVSAWGLLVGLLLACFQLVHLVLDRCRYAAWDAEWMMVNPRHRPDEDALS
jgi:hypothetical protein